MTQSFSSTEWIFDSCCETILFKFYTLFSLAVMTSPLVMHDLSFSSAVLYFPLQQQTYHALWRVANLHILPTPPFFNFCPPLSSHPISSLLLFFCCCLVLLAKWVITPYLMCYFTESFYGFTSVEPW